jgi:hypothetical protein
MVHSFQSIKAEFLEFALEDSREPFKDQMAESLRAVVHSIDPQLPLTHVKSMDRVIGEGQALRRFNTTRL